MAQEATGSGKPATHEPAATQTPTLPEDSALTPQERDELASKLVDRYAMWSGAAGLIPIPLVDIATVAGVQLQMVRRLSQMYGVPFSDNRGKSIIASLAGSMIPATSGMGAASVLKSIPVIGSSIAALTMPALSAGATYAIGKVFIQHFSSGGTLLDFNPPDYREFIRVQREKWNSRSRRTPGGTPPSSTPPDGSTGNRTATASM
jgi:uncharacterized protein (DUF697 family)